MLTVKKYIVVVISVVVNLLVISSPYCEENHKDFQKKLTEEVSLDEFEKNKDYYKEYLKNNSNPSLFMEYQLSIKYSKLILLKLNEQYKTDGSNFSSDINDTFDQGLYAAALGIVRSSPDIEYYSCSQKGPIDKLEKKAIKRNRKHSSKTKKVDRIKNLEKTLALCMNILDVNNLLFLYDEMIRRDIDRDKYIPKFNKLFMKVIEEDQSIFNYSYLSGKQFGIFVSNYYQFFTLINKFGDSERFTNDQLILITSSILTKYYHFHDMSEIKTNYIYRNGELNEYSARISTISLINLFNWLSDKKLDHEAKAISNVLCSYDYEMYDVHHLSKKGTNLTCE